MPKATTEKPSERKATPGPRAGPRDRINAAARRASAGGAEPLWAGPCGAGPEGGITQGILGRWFADRERCRLQTVGGWAPAPRFEPRLEFGNMWHACEEAHAGDRPWEPALEALVADLDRRFQRQRDEIAHWAGMTAMLFPEYVRFWAEHPEQVERTPMLQEQVFDVPFRLPSGRKVRLRGKWDSVDRDPFKRVKVQENKTKSGIDAVKIARQCRFDLQSLFYLTALVEWTWKWTRTDQPLHEADVSGVRYNCVRRPAHKTVESAAKKLGEDLRNGRSGEWFARFTVDVSADDLALFRRTCLEPALESVCDDFEWWADCFKRHGDVWNWQRRKKDFPHHVPRHVRLPYGVYSPVLEGGFSDLDALIEGGSAAGLVKAKTLFPELVQEDSACPRR